MWIIYGGLGLLGNLASLGATGGRAGTSGFVGLGISIGFLVLGIQALTGKARGMLAGGITSIVLGVIVLIAMLALSSLIRVHAPMAIFAVLGLVFGGILITAGILACVGNQKFKAWRATKGL